MDIDTAETLKLYAKDIDGIADGLLEGDHEASIEDQYDKLKAIAEELLMLAEDSGETNGRN